MQQVQPIEQEDAYDEVMDFEPFFEEPSSVAYDDPVIDVSIYISHNQFFFCVNSI